MQKFITINKIAF